MIYRRYINGYAFIFGAVIICKKKWPHMLLMQADRTEKVWKCQKW